MATRVIAPAVQVIVGQRAHHVLRGGLLPEGVDEADVERLTRKGMVVAVEDAPEPEPAEEEPPASEPEKKSQARKPAAK